MKNHEYAPRMSSESWSTDDLRYLEPFTTNVGNVAALRNLPPELAGALCSRASRAKGSLLRVFLDEYVYPVVNGGDDVMREQFEDLICFFETSGHETALDNNRARSFFAKWLAQYGDESIMQMMGTYLVFRGVSQVAMKHLEDSRIGVAPIEQSTRYVDFGERKDGRYLYYTDPDIVAAGLGKKYERVMDELFEAYRDMVSRMQSWLHEHFPDEKPGVVQKKAFDLARGFLPMSTLGQVAFYGNGQAFEYIISKATEHSLGELRWVAEASHEELKKIMPSLLTRLGTPKMIHYQHELGLRPFKMRTLASEFDFPIDAETNSGVRLVDADSEDDIIAAMLFSYSNSSLETLRTRVSTISLEDKKVIIETYIGDRQERWQKVGRALENSFVRFEITMNAGAYRDLQRQRMHTQERQLFTVEHGYDVPPEIEEAGFADYVHEAMSKVKELYNVVRDTMDLEHAQYASTLYHRTRFYQFQNIRQAFWEIELRTGSQGHPDYRVIEQEKYRLLEERFPLLCRHMKVDMGDYDFARRGQEERIKEKERRLLSRKQ
ncbi:MAG: FAD-dependent thymidylate synthase [bacterium]|nr:FAD-dependent thymidylate synthase [bacterium]